MRVAGEPREMRGIDWLRDPRANFLRASRSDESKNSGGDGGSSKRTTDETTHGMALR
jgi:hypothetical protein